MAGERKPDPFRQNMIRLMTVFNADIVEGGYASREIPWEIAAQVMGKTDRTGMLLPSEKVAAARVRRELQEKRDAIGPKVKRRGGGKLTRKGGKS